MVRRGLLHGLWVVVAAFLLGGIARAGGDDLEHEIRAAKGKIAAVNRAAEEAVRAGREREAEELAAKARDMARRLEAHVAERQRRLAEKRQREGEGRPEAKRREAILRGIGGGIEALRALGGQEHLVQQLMEIRRRLRGHAEAHPQGEHAERRIVGHWLELMGLARRVLAEANRREFAEILEHGMRALGMGLQGRHDPEAQRIRESAPPHARLAQALAMAAEILADHDQRDHARALRELAERFRATAREHGEREEHRQRDGREGRAEREERGEHGERDEAEEHEEAEGLRQRMEILRQAVRLLGEHDRGDAADLLRRAIQTGELMLAGREDAEAREIMERTPSLGQLARVLAMAAALAAGDGYERAQSAIERLARYYTRHARGQDVEWSEDAEREHVRGHGNERERARDAEQEARRHHLEELHRQMVELQKQLERIARDLERMR